MERRVQLRNGTHGLVPRLGTESGITRSMGSAGLFVWCTECRDTVIEQTFAQNSLPTWQLLIHCPSEWELVR